MVTTSGHFPEALLQKKKKITNTVDNLARQRGGC